MKRIESSCFGIVVELGEPDPEHEGGYMAGNITSDLHEDLPDPTSDEYDAAVRYDAAMDALESFILAAACAGIDITTPDFEYAIETAVQSCAQNFI